MSSVRRSSRQKRQDRLASAVRTPEDLAAAAIEGKRQAAELVSKAEATGLLTVEQAAELRERFCR